MVRGVFRKPDSADSRGDTDAFDIREFEDGVVSALVIGESGAVTVDGFAGVFSGGHGTRGNVGGDEGDLTDGPAAVREGGIVCVIEGLAHEVCSGRVSEEVDVDRAIGRLVLGEQGDAVGDQLHRGGFRIVTVFEIGDRLVVARPAECQDGTSESLSGEVCFETLVSTDDRCEIVVVAVDVDEDVAARGIIAAGVGTPCSGSEEFADPLIPGDGVVRPGSLAFGDSQVL